MGGRRRSSLPVPRGAGYPEDREPGSELDPQGSAPGRQPKAPAPPRHPSLAPGSVTTVFSLTGGPRSAPPVSTDGSVTGTFWASVETPAGWNYFRSQHAAIGCSDRGGAEPIPDWLRFSGSWWNATGRLECRPDLCRGVPGVPSASVCVVSGGPGREGGGPGPGGRELPAS